MQLFTYMPSVSVRDLRTENIIAESLEHNI